jgi:hypothetical protein
MCEIIYGNFTCEIIHGNFTCDIIHGNITCENYLSTVFQCYC